MGIPYYLINVDKGSQSEGGKKAVVVGDAAKPTCDEFSVYELKTLENRNEPLSLRSDEGENYGYLWEQIQVLKVWQFCIISKFMSRCPR